MAPFRRADRHRPAQEQQQRRAARREALAVRRAAELEYLQNLRHLR